MEKKQEKNIENHVLNVEVSSKNCISEKTKEIKPPLEDSNCNLTILTSKDNLILDQIDLIQKCDKLNEISLNGPKRLLNGVESGKESVNSCSSENLSLQDSSSHCKTCVNASDNKSEASAVSLNKNEVIQKPNEEPDDSSQSLVSSATNTDVVETPTSVASESSCSNVEETAHCSTSLSETQENSLPCSVADKQSECGEITYVSYESELQMPDIMRLIQKDLSEPYSIYTYRYFIHNWPQLCFLVRQRLLLTIFPTAMTGISTEVFSTKSLSRHLQPKMDNWVDDLEKIIQAMDDTLCVGAIVCKLDMHRKVVKRGYIAMLAVDEKYRKRKIGSNLVLKAIRAMVADGADEVVLETEITNKPALRLYENLGFVRDKRLFRYYLNGVDALRLKLWLR